MVYFLIFISAIFVNNIVLSQFLGICPFLGVSKKINTALGMGAAVLFVMTLATLVTYLLHSIIPIPVFALRAATSFAVIVAIFISSFLLILIIDKG